MTQAVKASEMDQAIFDMAQDMSRVGILDEPTSEKVTLRQLGAKSPFTHAPIIGDDIHARESRSEPSGVRALSQHDTRLRLAIRTRHQTTHRPHPRTAECDSAQRV
jgi:hypothetical protein